jgi:polar amino acid transport system substrate-binding protein
VDSKIVAELAPTGVLRAGINLGNGLLVTGTSPSGEPQGVAADMASEVASRLGVPVHYVTFERPSTLADAALDNVWDIALIGAEPARAKHIAFSAAYCEIEATYIVPENSKFRNAEDVDSAGSRIIVRSGSAYCLWLQENLRHAELLTSPSADGPFTQFMSDKLDALAGLRPALLETREEHSGLRILDGNFTSVQQAIGTQRTNSAGAAFLHDFAEEAKASGLVQSLIDRHKVKGLSVAPKFQA